MKRMGIIVLGAAFGLALSFASCGGSTPSQPSSEPAAATTTEASCTKSDCDGEGGCKCTVAKECGKAECGTGACAKQGAGCEKGEGCKCTEAKECGKEECGTGACSKEEAGCEKAEGCAKAAAGECPKAAAAAEAAK